MKTLEEMPAISLPPATEGNQHWQESRAPAQRTNGEETRAQFDDDLGEWEPIGLVVVGILRRL